MKAMDFLDNLLKNYTSTFDLYRPYAINGTEYPAYGYFFSHLEKYVLVREANLWKADSYEHILFSFSNTSSLQDITAAKDVMKNYMEPVLVRKGEKLPDANHMYSYLTYVIISEQEVSKDVIKAVRRFKYEVGYQFNIRGFSQGRLLLVDLEKGKVYYNYQGRKMKKLYEKVLKESKTSNDSEDTSLLNAVS